MTQSGMKKKSKKRLKKMDENDKIQILKHIRHLQVTVDIIIEMIEVGGESISYILHNLNVLYIEIENLIKKVNSDGME